MFPATTPRVLQVVLSLDPGGTERIVSELVLRTGRDIPTAVCCLDDDGLWAEGLRADDVDVSALHRGTGFTPGLGRAVARLAARHGANVLHCHHYSPFVYGCLARMWRPELRVVFTEHGRLSDGPPSTKRRAVNPLLSRVPHRIVTVSQDLKRHLVAEGFQPQRVEVVYNGIDVGPLPGDGDRAAVRNELDIAAGRFVVGTIARLDPVKDLPVLLRAAAMLDSASATVLVIGDGPERRRLDELARAFDRRVDVRFLGYRADARRLLAACDVFANSSTCEGVSLTILEAMAAGLPVVATRVGGTPEVIDAASGRLVPARDPAALASALRDLQGRPALARELGRAARARVAARFTLDGMVEAYRHIYTSVLHARREVA